MMTLFIIKRFSVITVFRVCAILNSSYLLLPPLLPEDELREEDDDDEYDGDELELLLLRDGDE